MFKPSALILATLLLLGPIVVAELGVRSLIETGRLPIAPSSNEFTDVSLANLARLGKPDVLVMGASTVRSGVRPDTLEKLITAETGQDVHVQSIAQGGMSLEAQRLLLRDLARRDLLPDTVITGVSPLTLGGGFAEGDDWLRSSELGLLLAGCGDDILDLDDIECRLGQGSALWRWRGRPERLASAAISGMPRTHVDGSRTLQADGWLAGGPAKPEQLARNVDRALARMDESIAVPDAVVEDYAAFIDEARSLGVEVVVLKMPYLAELESALVERNPDWADQRDDGFAALEAAAGMELLDVGGFGEWVQPSSFRDPRHLSRKGAGPFTKQLWAMPEFREPVLESLASAD